jgi:hypothetical protein
MIRIRYLLGQRASMLAHRQSEGEPPTDPIGWKSAGNTALAAVDST